MNQIKAVLSDIGNVIMPVRTDHFIQHLAQTAGVETEIVWDAIKKTIAVEHNINSGKMPLKQAFDEIIAGPLNITWEQFLSSWYALLGDDFPQVRQAYESLAVPLYVLSNINDVHAEYLHGRWFDEISIACWMSNEIGMIKPNREVYEFVLSQIKCEPAELLFFDDLKDNVNSAMSLGIDAVLVTHPDDVVKTLKKYGLLKVK